MSFGQIRQHELPPLSSLMRDHTERSELMRTKRSMGEEQERSGQLAMPTPIYLAGPNGYRPMEADNSGMPSPNPSPRTTRCPSRTDSVVSLPIGCSTPNDHSVPSHSDRLHHHYQQSRVSKQYESPRRRLSYSVKSASPQFAPVIRQGDHTHHHDEKLSKHEKRRRNHLNSEKKRRESIKGGMDALFELVPTCRDIHESKANILKKTKTYILEMHEALREAQVEIKRMSRENEELRRLSYNHGSSGFICRL